MKNTRLKLALVGVLVLAASRAFALVNVEVGLGGVQYMPEGNLGYKGIVLDVKSDLGYEKINRFTGRVKVDLPIIPSIYLQANPISFEGTGSKNISFQYGDRTFTANVPFTSSLMLDNYDLALYYSIPFLKTVTNEVLNVELGLNARYINFKSEIKQPLTGLSESKSQAIGVPMGYLGLHISPIDFLKLETELRGVGYGGNRYVDFAARLKFIFLKLGFVAGGYKYQNIVIDQNDIKSDLRFSGPMVEAGVEF